MKLKIAVIIAVVALFGGLETPISANAENANRCTFSFDNRSPVVGDIVSVQASCPFEGGVAISWVISSDWYYTAHYSAGAGSSSNPMPAGGTCGFNGRSSYDCNPVGLTLWMEASSNAYYLADIALIPVGRIQPLMQQSLTPAPILKGVRSHDGLAYSQPGDTLTAGSGTWDADVQLTYQWFRNADSIPGATSSSYEVTPDDIGYQLSVSAQGTKFHYNPVTRSSSAVPIYTNFDGTPVCVATSVVKCEIDFLDSTIVDKWDVPSNVTDMQISLVGGSGGLVPQVGSWLYGSYPGPHTNGEPFGTANQLDADIPTDLVAGKTIAVGVGSGAYMWTPGYNAISPIYSGSSGSFYRWPGLPLFDSIKGGSGGAATVFQILDINGDATDTISAKGTDGAHAATDYGLSVSGIQGMGGGFAGATIPDLIYSYTSKSVAWSSNGFARIFYTMPLPDQVLHPAVGVSGVPVVGSVLTAVPGVWDDGVVLSYQWTSGGVAIPGATGSTYSLVPGDLGASIGVTVSGEKTGYQSYLSSSDHVTVSAPQTFLSQPSPKLVGTAKAGLTVSLNAGIWEAGTTLSYQWFANGVAISGQTASSILISGSDVGKSLTVAVTASKPGFLSVIKLSNAVTIAAGTLVNQPAISITGIPLVGNQLSAMAGVWDDGVSFSYKWLRSGVAILGANSSTYILAASDLGKQISVAITASKTGFASVIKNSAAVLIGTGQLSNIPSVSLTGYPAVGKQLSVVSGQWAQGVMLSYKWTRSGVSVSGVTGPSYTLTTADASKYLAVSVTATKPGYQTVVVTSQSLLVLPGELTLQNTPSVTGNLIVGSTLSANPGKWDSGVVLSFQWLRNGNPISTATSSTYKLVSVDRGTSISVRLTASKSGYNTVVRTSPSVGPIT